MHLTITDAWFSGRTIVEIVQGDDRLSFERCTFHGGEVHVEDAVDRTIFIACLFQGTVFSAQKLNPRIAVNCQWQPGCLEGAMPHRSPHGHF